MSLAADSPSSSSDDFAAFLDAELEMISSDGDAHSTEGEEQEEEEEEEEEEEDDGGGGQVNDYDKSDIQEGRIKRRKLEEQEVIKEYQGPVASGTIKEMAAISSKCKDDIICRHPVVLKGLCVTCGQLEDDGSGVALGYIHKDLKLRTEEINRLREADLKTSLEKKRLILILDLDHTLINSTRLADISPEEEYLVRQADALKNDPNRSLFKLDSMHMLTKLRPFVRTFLEEANHLFEMYIYTMGERSYALEIAKLLDPGSVYFKSKVISQADCTERHRKGLDIVLGSESIVVILDDTEFVWQKHKENLLLMERYHFFSSSCRQFGFNAKSLSESQKDERESDGALSMILNVLKRTHQMFFDQVLNDDYSSRDVRQVLRRIRQEILQGCKVVFSRVFPSKSKAEDQPIWRMAEQLGATCATEVDASVTHVVSADTGTQKARWALQNGKFLVNPRWIEATNYFWERQREEDFLINNLKNH